MSPLTRLRLRSLCRAGAAAAVTIGEGPLLAGRLWSLAEEELGVRLRMEPPETLRADLAIRCAFRDGSRLLSFQSTILRVVEPQGASGVGVWVRAPQLTRATERRSAFRIPWIDNDAVRATLIYEDRAVPVALRDLSVGGARFVPLTPIDLARWAPGAWCALRLEGPHRRVAPRGRVLAVRSDGAIVAFEQSDPPRARDDALGALVRDAELGWLRRWRR